MYCSHLKRNPPRRPQPKMFQPQEAAQQIAELVFQLLPQSLSENLSDVQLEFYVNKFVLDVLDYCHIDKFPEALIYSAVDLIKKRIADEAASFIESTETSIVSSNLPLSEIKMDDTTYKFAVNSVDLSGCLADLDFDSIKPKLNLYRRMIAW